MKTSLHIRLSMIILMAVLFAALLPGKVRAEESGGTLHFGTAEEYSTAAPGNVLKDSFYFDDTWFLRGAETERNDSLALVSMQLTASALENEKEGRCAEFLEKLGFQGITSHSLGADDVGMGYTYGIKNIGDGTTLAAIVVHSYALDKTSKKSAWLQNFTINGEGVTSGEHYSYRMAAARFPAIELRDQMTSLGGGNRRLKFWIMGQSRGGAIANVTAARLQNYADSPLDVCCYTFEAPAVIDADSVEKTRDYRTFHNYLCGDDLVAMIPPWGMVRYGETHDLLKDLEQKDITDDAVNEMMASMGSSLQISDSGILEQIKPDELVDKLVGRIGSREGYSENRTDNFTSLPGDSGGSEEESVKYNYQKTFRNLMGLLFGEEGISMGDLPGYLMDIFSSLEPLVRGYMVESGELVSTYKPEAYYWDSALKLYDILDSLTGETGNAPLDKEDLYVVLKLAAPVIVDKEAAAEAGYEITGEEIPLEYVIAYLNKLMLIAGNSEQFTISHQFDTLLARMKLLAPAPEMAELDLEVPEPAVGDLVTYAPGKLVKAADDLGYSWLGVSAVWDTEDKSIRRNKEYYLNAEFEIIGHTVPSDLKLTINGREPAKAPDIVSREGVTTVRAAWKFRIGNPGEYTVSFDVDDHGTAPEPITVPAGEQLKYLTKPIVEDSGEYILSDWVDIKGTPWDEITVTGDMMLSGRWYREIDHVEVSFPIPKVGQKTWEAPRVPKDALYRIDDFSITDHISYNTVTGAIPEGELSLEFRIYAKKDVRFRLIEEWGGYDFDGTVTVNGEPVIFYYESDEDYIGCTFYFEAAASVPDSGKEEESTVPGKGTSAADADKKLTKMKSDKDPAGAEYAPLKLQSGKQTGSTVRLNWKKAGKAVKYVVYGNLSGKKNALKKLAETKKTSYTVKKAGKKLKKGKYYKFIVIALDGNKKVVSTSSIIHVAVKGSKKAGNYKSVKVRVKKDGKYKALKKLTLKKGKKSRIKATPVRASKKVKVRSILKTRYASTNAKVAKVSAKGVIKAVGKGTCTIHVYLQNGVGKAIRITVK